MKFSPRIPLVCLPGVVYTFAAMRHCLRRSPKD